mgnify:CR=1 FL=1
MLFLLFSLLQNPCFKGAGCQGFVNPGISRIFKEFSSPLKTKRKQKTKQKKRPMATIRDRRLALESQSLRNDPLPFVATEPAVEPSSDGVATWHVNIFAPAGIEVSLHLIIYFPVKYPLTAPRLFVATPYCHQNVDQVAHANGMYSVCLDMLSSSDTTTKWSGW